MLTWNGVDADYPWQDMPASLCGYVYVEHVTLISAEGDRCVVLSATCVSLLKCLYTFLGCDERNSGSLNV